MRPFWIENFGNASSIHQQGQYARAAVDHARESVARLLHCRASEIVFTSGGTESDNLALFGVLNKPREPGAQASPHHLQHRAPRRPPRRPVARKVVPTRPRRGHLSALQRARPHRTRQPRAALRPNTKLVTIMLANNETGVIQPIAELADIAHAAGALFHTDAVQAAAKLPLDLSPKGALKDVDLLSLSGHKMYAPQGTGALFVRRSVRLAPLFLGGTTSASAAPAPKTSPASSASAKPPNSPRHGSAIDAPAGRPITSPPCATASSKAPRLKSNPAESTEPAPRASPTPPTSTSTASKPKRSSSPSTLRASPSAEAPPASPAPPNPPTSSPPWASPPPAPAPASASPYRASPPRPK